tara:strand:- start:1010 stop:1186 length:177 start_codon:yes stop_codon:yes gene_type:complete
MDELSIYTLNGGNNNSSGSPKKGSPKKKDKKMTQKEKAIQKLKLKIDKLNEELKRLEN